MAMINKMPGDFYRELRLRHQAHAQPARKSECPLPQPLRPYFTTMPGHMASCRALPPHSTFVVTTAWSLIHDTDFPWATTRVINCH